MTHPLTKRKIGHALLINIGQDTIVQNAHKQDDLWGAMMVFFEDGMGLSFYIAKHDEHYSEIILWQQ